MISAVPNVPGTEGKSMYPFMMMTLLAGTYLKPVMAHLLPCWTAHPISPEVPDWAKSLELLA